MEFMEDIDLAKQILKQYHQEHLWNFWEELTEEEKHSLVSQILSIDFAQILQLYNHSKIDEIISPHDLSALPYTDKEELSSSEINSFEKIGNAAISKGKVAMVTLAGGQGTRLGYKGPKGTFELDLKPKKSLFEIICDNLKEINDTMQTTIPWYIMTSIYNDEATKLFFQQKNYFGYPKDAIFFFSQSELPIIDTNGNLVLEETFKIKEASNGNGDVFSALAKAGYLSSMKKQGIEWVFFAGIDNVLLKGVDPLLLGLTIQNGHLTASKTLRKENPDDKDWIFASKKGKPSIVDCCYLTEEMKTQIDASTGHDCFRDINVLSHLFHISALEQLAKDPLPYHRAFKKNTFVNEEGMKQVPEKPNTFKFENFIFDAFAFFPSIQLLRVKREDEFAPIKDFNGPYNPEVATILYEKVKLHREHVDEEKD